MSKKLRGLVFTALDNAYEGGYESVLTNNAAREAQSLMDHDADVGDWCQQNGDTEDDVAVLVREWQRNKKEKLS